ncbi:Lactoylglutathione lyase [Labilithrix luteola]|uniref:Lactoylglutathione lyase n=1 Tax=Labilithrix luteola TaxID=1391654 RepID=A0A0K1Q632_9BACT|nr:VOC family protein [Labilithrix luteola]AKV01193.1 Lactoylglutathione lyase [Labilithrix luteola]
MRLHHLALRTGDLERLERFYVDVLGLAVVARTPPRSVWLDAAGTLVMLERKNRDEPSVPEGSLELVAFAVDPEGHERLASRLREAGIAIEASTSYSVYFRDPDGRRVGLSSYPTPRTTVEAPAR